LPGWLASFNDFSTTHDIRNAIGRMLLSRRRTYAPGQVAQPAALASPASGS